MGRPTFPPCTSPPNPHSFHEPHFRTPTLCGVHCPKPSTPALQLCSWNSLTLQTHSCAFLGCSTNVFCTLDTPIPRPGWGHCILDTPFPRLGWGSTGQEKAITSIPSPWCLAGLNPLGWPLPQPRVCQAQIWGFSCVPHNLSQACRGTSQRLEFRCKNSSECLVQNSVRDSVLVFTPD